ncbi:MAG: hypothetical protein ACRDS9_04685, partial [Pseudonocardiaceae bacterium]
VELSWPATARESGEGSSEVPSDEYGDYGGHRVEVVADQHGVRAMQRLAAVVWRLIATVGAAVFADASVSRTNKLGCSRMCHVEP